MPPPPATDRPDDARPGCAGVASPLPGQLRLGLRAAVLAHKVAAPRGHLAPVLWAGSPGSGEPGRACAFRPSTEDRLDHDVRVELAVALANRALPAVTDPMLWLTRSGDLEESPEDLAWLAAGVAAWSELGLAPSFAVLTRHGWRHHPSGDTQAWKRLRARS